jgi:hypothetical protein
MLVALVEAAGFERFSVFGYSPLYPEIQALSAAAETDPAPWADLNSRFDNRAALEFYRELPELPPDFLLDDPQCRCSPSGARKTRRSPGEAECNCSPPHWTVAGSSTRPSPVVTTKAC